MIWPLGDNWNIAGYKRACLNNLTQVKLCANSFLWLLTIENISVAYWMSSIDKIKESYGKIWLFAKRLNFMGYMCVCLQNLL
jgi:hypothetical protein